MPAQDLSDVAFDSTPEELDAIFSQWASRLGNGDSASSGSGPTTTAAQDPQPAPTASQGSGVALSGAIGGFGDETVATDGSVFPFDDYLIFDE